jgi:hypothetical protein
MPKRASADFYQGLGDFIRQGNPAGLGALFQPGFDPAIAAIYRNGFYRSCREVLVSTYGSVHHWLGDHEFAMLARAYTDRHPPQQGTLTGYGASFSEWLNTQLDESQCWLVEMARLDWAWLVCLHGMDGTPLTPQTVQTLTEEGGDVAHLPIGLLANASLISTKNVVFSLWSGYKSGDSRRDARPAIEQAPQAILVWRPATEVYARALSNAEWLFLAELKREQNLGAASAAVLEIMPDFNLAGLFAQLLENGVLQLAGERPWQR